MRLHVGVAAVGLLSSALAAIEDIAHCDPSDKDEHCPPDPGFATKAVFDFTNATFDHAFRDFWALDEDTAVDEHRIDFDSDEWPDEDGVALGIYRPSGDVVSLTSNKYLFFGKVSVEVRAAAARGVITKIMLKSDSGNEIDWEILGNNDLEAQTNYFYDGNAEFNKYNDTYPVASSVFAETHTYSVEWTQEEVSFSIDGEHRKTKKVGDIPAGEWPHAPMHVALSVWAVDEDDYDGVVDWADGLPDWDDAPFKAYFHRIEIEDYTGYCKEIEGEVEYSYNERMVDWRQVTVSGCKYKQDGILTPHVPSGGVSVATDTSGGYPEPTGDATTTGGGAEQTSGEQTSDSGDDEATSTDGGSAPPQETGEDEEDAATTSGYQTSMLLALVATASLMGML